MRKREKTVRVIPGFGVSLGVTVAMVSLIVLIPLASLALTAAQLEPRAFFETVTRPRVVSAFGVSVGCALLAALVNLVFGVMLAWVLTRYDFPLKLLADGEFGLDGDTWVFSGRAETEAQKQAALAELAAAPQADRWQTSVTLLPPLLVC
ncbi:MAG: hypothetical protein VB065_06880, partial [Eubacteriales bacterium]|nr:hypothetical protein [Eubacteriales bacterium]